MSTNASPPSSPDCSPLVARKKNDEISQDIALRVKCNSPGINPSPSPTGDYEIIARPSSTVSNLKELVRNEIGQNARGRYLRIIAGGRLLAPDMAPLKSFKLRDGDCLHAVLAPAGVRGGQQAAMSRGLTPTSRRGRSQRGVGIGSTGLVLPPPSDDSDSDLEVGPERMGFDRLRSTGLTRDEIAAIRLYFSRQVDRFIEERDRQTLSSSVSIDSTESAPSSTSSIPPSNDENDSTTESPNNTNSRLRRLQMEDEWMETQGPTSEFRLNLNTNNPLLMNRSFLLNQEDAFGASVTRSGGFVGTDRDFVWGFILGFFVGFIMLFWVWMPTVPHKQKLGILTGISFQLAINLMKNWGGPGIV